MSELILGKDTSYPDKYSPEILFPIPRSKGRDNIGKNVEYFGYDIWNCYEVSWLNMKGKPEVRIFEIYVPASSPNIIESKSLKLYLFSLNNEKFESEAELLKIVKSDLEAKIGSTTEIISRKISDYDNEKIYKPEGESIDDIDIEVDYENAESAEIKFESAEIVEESLYSDLHKTNCLITHQPDWASVMISYRGAKIERASLLNYIVSHRNANMFHEHSVEKIYADLISTGKFQDLTIYARYTRRGGLDINPIRSNKSINIDHSINKRFARQ